MYINRYIYRDLSFPVQSQMRSDLSNGPDAPEARFQRYACRGHLRLRTSTCV